MKITAEQLLKMSDEEMRIRFKNFEQVRVIKKEVEKEKEKENLNGFMKKYKICPKCKAPIEKFVGYYIIKE